MSETSDATEPRPVLFLSDAWVLAVDEALATLAPLAFEPPITIEYRISGGPEGDRTHRITLGPAGIGAHRPPGSDGGEHRDHSADVTDPTVTLSVDWELALDINQGKVSAQEAFLDGRIRLAGDPSALLTHQDQLNGIDDVVASIRVRTTIR